MSLGRKVRQATERAFRRMSGDQVTVKYQDLGKSTYNTTTKKVSREVLKTRNLRGFLTSLEEKGGLSGATSPEKKRFTYRFNSSIDPKPDDVIVYQRQEWRIESVKKELSSSIVILMLEKR